jgi:hypothetical protein
MTPGIPAAQGRLSMASMSTGSRHYENVEARDNSHVHLGDNYYYQGSSDERALKAILDSLSYPSMTERRDTLAEAHDETFDWAFLEGETSFKDRNTNGTWHGDCYEIVDVGFRSWLQQEEQGLFCVTGKPGSGKSTFMCV